MTNPVVSHFWWLASRASGLVALGLITVSVALGLTMSSRMSRFPRLKAKLIAIHEHTATFGLVAIGVHGVTLLGDSWLNPGLKGLAVPFTMSYRPLWTGLGIVGGYVAAILGLSFYARRRIGARLWRKAHRFTPVAYALAVAHTIGAGTDASTPWMRWWLLISVPAIGTLFLFRVASSIFGSSRTGGSAPAPAARPQPATAAPSAHRPRPHLPHLPELAPARTPVGEEA